ncbi:MAG: hypothetical protein N2Z22_06495 [Turneriella sp.]|nr:hypothetical protein [Turneriella sp.]
MPIFSYQPEFNYDAVNPANSEETNKHLLPFKGGLLKGLEAHLVNAESIQKFLATAPPEIRKEINRKFKEIDSALLAIIRLYGNVEEELSPRVLDTVAHREYYNHFSNAEMDDAKLEYVKLLRSYEVIKQFNLEVTEQWWKLARIFEAFGVTSADKHYMEQLLVYRVYPRIDLCNLTNLLLRRMAYLLNIESEETVGGRIRVRGQYTSQIHYSYSAIFREDLADIIEALRSVPKAQPEGKPRVAEPVKEIRDTAIKSPFLLDTRGSEPFNQTFAYVLEINEARFTIEQAKLQRSIYVETHLGAEEDALRKDLIRRFISAARNKDRAGEYRNFLFNYFQFVRETLLLQEKRIPANMHLLYLYHFGPVFFVRICAHFMRVGRTGYIHRHLRRKQMARELPYEYVKYVLKDWWDENVYTQVPKAERNNAAAYETILESVRQEWQEHQLQLLAKIRRDPLLTRALNLHDVKTLGQFVENEISYVYYVKILRFIGQDFFYLPLNASKVAARIAERQASSK